MKFNTFFIALALVTVMGLSAEAGERDPRTSGTAMRSSISGVVTDKSTSEKLAGVTIVLTSTGQKIYTDTKGEFSFDGIEPGTYTVKIQCISYKDREVTIDVKPAKGKKLQVVLNPIEP